MTNWNREILTGLVFAYTLTIMFGMGSSIDIDIFEEVRRAPKATLSGVASQYLFMPAITFGLCIAFDLGNTEALALQLCGMCPGGVTSTFFTYVCRANVSLSLILTTCSNFLAIGMMPFLVWVYVRPPLVSRNEDTKVNYLSIVLTLVVATLPAIAGWRLRRTRPDAGKRAETWATRVGVVLLLGALGLSLYDAISDSNTPTGKAYAVMALMCPLGFLLGFGFAKAMGLDPVAARTVSLETGIQQVGIAGAIILETLKGDELDRGIAVVVIFGLFTVFFGALWSGLLRVLSAAEYPRPCFDASADYPRRVRGVAATTSDFHGIVNK